MCRYLGPKEAIREIFKQTRALQNSNRKKKILGERHATSNENLYAHSIVVHTTHMHTQRTVGLVVQEALITVYNLRIKQTKNYVYTSSFH